MKKKPTDKHKPLNNQEKKQEDDIRITITPTDTQRTKPRRKKRRI
jgi:hypothetical protein